MGQRRRELSLSEIYEAFQERSDMEHFFRFTKQKLLLDDFQTPETAHEEHWWITSASGLLTTVGGPRLGSQSAPALGTLSASGQGESIFLRLWYREALAE